MKKLIIAGGQGFLGRALAKTFEKDHDVYILTRKPKRSSRFKQYKWDGKTLGEWTQILEEADLLINLSGKSVNCRYTESNKQEIYNSRIESTRVLGEAIKACKTPPVMWMNSSSGTIYSHSLEKNMTESDGVIGSGFSVDVCLKWEKEFEDIKLENTKKVILRTAIVLSKTEGAMKPLLNLSRLGFGGKLGNGNQSFSWIHVDDFVRALQFIYRKGSEGVYNISSTDILSNKEVMREIGLYNNPALRIPLSETLLELGARIIQTETELILKSRRVFPERLINEGFRYKYPDLRSALNSF